MRVQYIKMNFVGKSQSNITKYFQSTTDSMHKYGITHVAVKFGINTTSFSVEIEISMQHSSYLSQISLLPMVY